MESLPNKNKQTLITGLKISSMKSWRSFCLYCQTLVLGLNFDFTFVPPLSVSFSVLVAKSLVAELSVLSSGKLGLQ